MSLSTDADDEIMRRHWDNVCFDVVALSIILVGRKITIKDSSNTKSLWLGPRLGQVNWGKPFLAHKLQIENSSFLHRENFGITMRYRPMGKKRRNCRDSMMRVSLVIAAGFLSSLSLWTLVDSITQTNEGDYGHFYLSLTKYTYHRRTTTIESTLEPFPPQCTPQQLHIVEQQLPAGDCQSNQRRPWNNKCSFSYASRCPDAVWLEEETTSPRNNENPFVSIYVGCNKGMDAVDTLRRTSGDPTIDRSLWKGAMLQDTIHEKGRCQQEHAPQPQIYGNQPRDAVVHCIEAMPITARQLQASSETLGWSDRLIVYNMAVSQTDGMILFPDADKMGVENLGLDQCDNRKKQNHPDFTCKEVPSYKLDTFATKYLMKSEDDEIPIIDFISIDVEGYDFEVLMGSTMILNKTRYIEFEYNWKGPWGSHRLSEAVARLRNASMVCYWAGTHGYAWRITDCWQDSYDLKFWSNVACAHAKLAPDLLDRLEHAFQSTLRLGDRVRYDTVLTANTNGGFSTITNEK